MKSASLHKAMVGGENDRAGSPTLCRFENRQNGDTALRWHGLMVEGFIESFEPDPEGIILDFAASAHPLDGHKKRGAFFMDMITITAVSLARYLAMGNA